mmetsp:Transcript_29643/g.54595  ORF Transcript_29643/g.54595 Transcript_29643/m.54595 type:complete len:264 (+) Transcript_29643:1038-1829(+)
MYTVTGEPAPYYAQAGSADAHGSEEACKFWHIFAAAALAGGAGIRATAPLFLLSYFNLSDPKEYPLSKEASWLGHQEICIGLGALLLLEILADQIPAVDHALHAILTPAHPITGAVAAIAPNYCGGHVVRVPMAFLGASTALGVHAGKAILRGGSSGVSCGMLNPCLSVIETVFMFLLLFMSITVPACAIGVTILFCTTGAVGAQRMLLNCRRNPEGDEDLELESASEDETEQLRQENRRLREQLAQQDRRPGDVRNLPLPRE